MREKIQSISVGTRIPETLHARLVARAGKDRISLNKEIVGLLSAALTILASTISCRGASNIASPKEKLIPVGTRIPEALHASLVARAKEGRRSLNREIIDLLSSGLSTVAPATNYRNIISPDVSSPAQSRWLLSVIANACKADYNVLCVVGGSGYGKTFAAQNLSIPNNYFEPDFTKNESVLPQQVLDTIAVVDEPHRFVNLIEFISLQKHPVVLLLQHKEQTIRLKSIPRTGIATMLPWPDMEGLTQVQAI